MASHKTRTPLEFPNPKRGPRTDPVPVPIVRLETPQGKVVGYAEVNNGRLYTAQGRPSKIYDANGRETKAHALRRYLALQLHITASASVIEEEAAQHEAAKSLR